MLHHFLSFRSFFFLILLIFFRNDIINKDLYTVSDLDLDSPEGPGGVLGSFVLMCLVLSDPHGSEN